MLFAVGLLGASLLAAAVLPVTAAYVISETFGFEKASRARPREAPVFVGVVTTLVVIGAVVAMIPGVPVFRLLVGVQAVNGVLLPITLFFVWRLSASREMMGEHRNGRDLQPPGRVDRAGDVGALAHPARCYRRLEGTVRDPLVATAGSLGAVLVATAASSTRCGRSRRR